MGKVTEGATARALTHVLWIGGSPCAGKRTIPERLAARYHAEVYHYDRMEPSHMARSNVTNNPALMEFLALDMDGRWLLRTPEVMAANVIASWMARFALAIEDLLAMPSNCVIVAEGPGLFPECVAPVLSNRHQAIWLTSTPELCATVRRGRPGSYLETSNPAETLRLLVARDGLLAEQVEQEAREHDLPLVRVDGRRALDDMEALVAAHFAPYLASLLGPGNDPR